MNVAVRVSGLMDGVLAGTQMLVHFVHCDGRPAQKRPRVSHRHQA